MANTMAITMRAKDNPSSGPLWNAVYLNIQLAETWLPSESGTPMLMPCCKSQPNKIMAISAHPYVQRSACKARKQRKYRMLR